MTGKLRQVAQEKSGWSACRWLVLRRVSQLGILGLFLLGPLAGVWIIKGNISSSLTLGVLPLSDPYVLLQSVFAGHLPEMTAAAGAAVVLGAYWLLGGRVYCAWVCPVNIITDAAAWCRRKMGIGGSGLRLDRNARYWLLGATLLVAALTGRIAWELVNPVTSVYRGAVFGLGLTWLLIPGLFLFDLFVSRRGWCGHLCPVGAFYSLPGRYGLVRVSAAGRDNCNDCMDCFTVCPEPQVIKPALKPDEESSTALILSGNCTNCARCIDVCSRDVFSLTHRFSQRAFKPATNAEGSSR